MPSHHLRLLGGFMIEDGWERVNDEGTQLVWDAYQKALGRMSAYVGRGYWKAAERWASVAFSLGDSVNEVSWRPVDREDA
jgi:hypothetical protein